MVKNINSIIIIAILLISCMATKSQREYDKKSEAFHITLNIQKNNTDTIYNVCLGDTIEIVTEYLNIADSAINLSIRNSMLIQDYSGAFV